MGVQCVHSVQRKEFTFVKFSDFLNFLFVAASPVDCGKETVSHVAFALVLAIIS